MDLLDAIGNTALIPLRTPAGRDGGGAFVKLEWENPEAEKMMAASRAAWARRREEERAAEAERNRERDLRREAAARGYLEWREREQVRRAELVALNRVCPRCGLTYAWAGHNCGHCRHP